HTVKIEYFDATGGASVSFGWLPPGVLTDALQQAVDAAKASDVAVVMVGDNEAEGRDRPSMARSPGQDDLVRAVVAANPRHVEVEREGGQVTVEVDVTNTGRRTGAQVVQVYVGHPDGTAVPEPPHQLGGFLKVTLRPGQTQHVRIRLAARAFSYWDVTKHD